MPVRIRVRIESLRGTSAGGIIESAAIVNSGFEAETRDASLPSGLARRIGLWPPPAESRRHLVRAYVGEGQVILVPEAVKMQVVTPDRTGQAVSVNVLITELDDEVVLSDTLAEALNIVLLRPGAGLWCFQDEPTSPGRPSEPAQRW